METSKIVRLGEVCLGAGRTKICIPLMGKTPGEFAAMAINAQQAGADLLEIRLDSMGAEIRPEDAKSVCDAVHGVSGLPRILTFRTERDGGAGTGDPLFYGELLKALAQTNCCEALDVELSCGEAIFADIQQMAKVPIIGSYHDFTGTPTADVIREKLTTAEQWGAHVAKIAVMPQAQQDVVRLIDAACGIKDRMTIPLIAISMGALGVPSRVCCALTGSCLTFASAGKTSAPGQIEAAQLKEMLSVMEGTENKK